MSTATIQTLDTPDGAFTMLERDAARRPTVQACLEAVEALLGTREAGGAGGVGGL